MSVVKKIPERSELCEADKWALEDLYPSDEAYEADLAKFKKLTAVFEMSFNQFLHYY